MREEGDRKCRQPLDPLQKGADGAVFDMHGDHVDGIVSDSRLPIYGVERAVLAGSSGDLVVVTLGDSN